MVEVVDSMLTLLENNIGEFNLFRFLEEVKNRNTFLTDIPIDSIYYFQPSFNDGNLDLEVPDGKLLYITYVNAYNQSGGVDIFLVNGSSFGYGIPINDMPRLYKPGDVTYLILTQMVIMQIFSIF